MSDYDDPDVFDDPHGAACSSIKELREQSFRRGFSQGVYAMFEAVRDGFSLDDLEAYWRRVYEWRCEEHGGKIIYPEWLARNGATP